MILKRDRYKSLNGCGFFRVFQSTMVFKRVLHLPFIALSLKSPIAF